MISLTPEEVVDAVVVQVVDCPSCSQRRGDWVSECLRCGMCGKVDLDLVANTVHECLSDAFNGLPLPGFIPSGFYGFADSRKDCYLVRADRSVHFVSPELLDDA